MDIVITIAVTLGTLAVLIAVHEFGHFWVARRCGVRVLRFSIGFGKPLYRWHDRLGTEYSLAVIPLGGYVKMLGERDGDVPEEFIDQAFNHKPVLQRIAVVSAGPLANLLLAVLVFWGLFMAGESGYAPVIGQVDAGSPADLAGLEVGQEIVAVDGEATPTWQALSFALLERIGDTGTITLAVKYPDSNVIHETGATVDRWLSEEDEPDLFAGLGIAMYTPAGLLAREVMKGSAAERAGLLAGDVILGADGIRMHGSEWVDYVRARPGQPLTLEIERDGEQLLLPLTPAVETTEDGQTVGRAGVMVSLPPMPPELVRKFSRGPVEAAGAALSRTGELIGFTLSSLKKMLLGQISLKNLSGPITIAKVATASAKSGVESYLGLLALLSVSLGVLNLLPIPVLDGGHLLFYTIELLAGRPVPERIQTLGYQVGLFLVVGLMMLALYNDLTRQ